MLISAKNILLQLNELRKLGKYCDVVLVNGQCRFPCHRAVLAAAVPYFDGMFGNEFKEKTTYEVTLNNNLKSGYKCIDEIGLKFLLDYIYIGKDDLKENIIKNVLSIAAFMRVECLLDKCIKYIVRNLGINNIIDYYLFADDIGVDKLKNCTMRYIQENFVIVSGLENFLQIPFFKFQVFFNSDFTYVENERYMYELLMKWLNYDIEARSQYAAELLKTIRFSLIEKSFITENVLKDNSVIDPAGNNINIILENSSREFSPRICRTGLPIYAFGRKNYNGSWELAALRYDGVAWNEAAHLNQKRNSKYWQATVSNGSLFMITFSSIMEMNFGYFNNENKTWIALKMVPLNMPMYNMISLDVINGIYINISPRIPEFTQERHYKLYCYCADVDNWHCMSSSLEYCIHSSTLISYGNIFYSCGGINLNGCNADCLLLFDPRTGVWTKMSSMLNPNSFTAGTILNDKLYITGGWTGSQALNTVQMYDIRANKWQSLKEMSKHRHSHSLINFRNKLYAIGGKQSVVEIYDPRSNLWSDGPNITCFQKNEIIGIVY